MKTGNKPILRVIVQDEENLCAKCCKTRQVIDRMLESLPELKKSIELNYENVTHKEAVEDYGEFSLPIIKINENVFSKGHIPVIKKLSRALIKLID